MAPNSDDVEMIDVGLARTEQSSPPADSSRQTKVRTRTALGGGLLLAIVVGSLISLSRPVAPTEEEAALSSSTTVEILQRSLTPAAPTPRTLSRALPDATPNDLVVWLHADASPDSIDAVKNWLDEDQTVTSYVYLTQQEIHAGMMASQPEAADRTATEDVPSSFRITTSHLEDLSTALNTFAAVSGLQLVD